LSLLKRKIIIIGGGPVGCTVALALQSIGLESSIVEERDQPLKSTDGRTLALSYNSHLVLERLGINLKNSHSFPIDEIHISDRGNFGRSIVRASDINLPSLGYAVRFNDFYQNLYSETVERSVEVLHGMKVARVDNDPSNPKTISIESEATVEKITADLVIIADGGSINLRGDAPPRETDYGHQAIVGLLKTKPTPSSRAFERFTDSGPIALLPRGEEYAFVWSCGKDDAAKILELPDESFLSRLQDAFGDRAGQFLAVREKISYPLRMRITDQASKSGIIFLGNASQALHPIAAQGLNLGLRDAWTLAQLCKENTLEDISNIEFSTRYMREREKDRKQTIAATKFLNTIFSNQSSLLGTIRGLGLMALDLAPSLKRAVLRQLIFGPGY